MEIVHIFITIYNELNRFSSTGFKGLCSLHMKFSQTGKIVFNTHMRPICLNIKYLLSIY